jgi:hypothetical protein
MYNKFCSQGYRKSYNIVHTGILMVFDPFQKNKLWSLIVANVRRRFITNQKFIQIFYELAAIAKFGTC